MTIPQWILVDIGSMAMQQEPKLEVPTVYKAYFLGLCKGISPQNMAGNMVQYLHLLDPEILIDWLMGLPG